MKRPAASLVLRMLFALILICVSGRAAAQTAAERLLAIAASGKPASNESIRREISALYAQMSVPQRMRRDEPMAHWDVKLVPGGSRSLSIDHDMLLVRGSVSLKQANFAVVIATGDVEVESGAGLVIVAGGNIRFKHNPSQDWSGVFVSRRKVVAPWVANLVVHAAEGLELSENSVGISAINTQVRSRAPKPAAQGFSFAGKRCLNGPPIREIADAVPAIARAKAQCTRGIQLVIANCDREDAAGSDETWTVHLCENVIVDVSAKRAGGRSQIAFKPFAANVPTNADAITTTTRSMTQPGVASAPTTKSASAYSPGFGTMAPRGPGCSPGQEVSVSDQLVREGDLDGAIRVLDQALDSCESGWAYDRRGMLRLRRGDAEGALADLDRSVAQAWTAEVPVFNRSLAYLFLARPDDAIRELNHLLGQWPHRPMYLLYRGWAQVAKGRHAEACADAEGSVRAVVHNKWGAGDHRSEAVARATILSHIACGAAGQARRTEEIHAMWGGDMRGGVWPDQVAIYLRNGGDSAVLRKLAAHPSQLAELEGILALDDLRKGRPEAAKARFAAARAASPGYSFATAFSLAHLNAAPAARR